MTTNTAKLTAAIRSNTSEKIAAENAAHTAAEFASQYKVASASLHSMRKLASINYASIPCIVGGTKKNPVWKDIEVPAKVVAANVKLTKDGTVESGVVFFHVNLAKVSRRNLSALVANKVLLPPTKDGANLLVRS